MRRTLGRGLSSPRQMNTCRGGGTICTDHFHRKSVSCGGWLLARTTTPTAQRYAAFWSQLLPHSNRQTGFSIRNARRQASIEFCYLGFCFRYWLHDDQPDARVQFALERSDADTIYATLSRSRTAIDQAFGAELEWHQESFSATRRAAGYEIVYRIPSPPLRDLPPEQWQDLQDRMIDAMVRLERTLYPRLKPWFDDDFF